MNFVNNCSNILEIDEFVLKMVLVTVEICELFYQNAINTGNDDNVIYSKDTCTCVNDSILNEEYDFAENVVFIAANTDTSFSFSDVPRIDYSSLTLIESRCINGNLTSIICTCSLHAYGTLLEICFDIQCIIACNLNNIYTKYYNTQNILYF